MRAVTVCGGVAMAAALGLMLGLSGCGKSGQNTSGTVSPEPSSAPNPATALTDAQKQALVASLGPAYQGADLSNGEAKFAVCRSCHTTAEGGPDMTGPNLWGVFGRKAGAKADFSYSDDLKNAPWVWDADRINKWIENPRAVLPSTKMTYIGMADANDRRDVIAFLKTQTSPPPKG